MFRQQEKVGRDVVENEEIRERATLVHVQKLKEEKRKRTGQRDREAERETEREKQRERDRERDIERETEREKERERERERDGGIQRVERMSD